MNPSSLLVSLLPLCALALESHRGEDTVKQHERQQTGHIRRVQLPQVPVVSFKYRVQGAHFAEKIHPPLTNYYFIQLLSLIKRNPLIKGN
jgi:hypothetical protein